MTQRELAERLDLKPQQVQRYEANRYAGASVQRLEEVLEALNLRLECTVRLPVACTQSLPQSTETASNVGQLYASVLGSASGESELGTARPQSIPTKRRRSLTVRA